MALTKTKDFKIALFFCVLVISSFVIFIPPSFVERGDFHFHYLKTLGQYDDTGLVPDRSFDYYAPLGHFLASFFTFNIHSFYYFILLLTGLITPMLLFNLCRKWVVVPLYFCCTSYFYFMFMTLSQALTGVLFLLLLNTKNNYLRILILAVSISAHSQSFKLLAISFMIILLFETFNFKRIFLGCSGVFGTDRPDEVLDVTLVGEKFPFGYTVGTLFDFAFKLFPFPFFIIGIFKTIKNRRYELLLIALFVFIAASRATRALYIIPLLFLPQVADFYNSEWQRKYKLLFMLVVILFGYFEFISWYNIGVLC